MMFCLYKADFVLRGLQTPPCCTSSTHEFLHLHSSPTSHLMAYLVVLLWCLCVGVPWVVLVLIGCCKIHVSLMCPALPLPLSSRHGGIEHTIGQYTRERVDAVCDDKACKGIVSAAKVPSLVPIGPLLPSSLPSVSQPASSEFTSLQSSSYALIESSRHTGGVERPHWLRCAHITVSICSRPRRVHNVAVLTHRRARGTSFRGVQT